MSRALDAPIRILELRSVFGTGGGPEKTILLGTARNDATEFQITVCYLRASTDSVFHIDEKARALGVNYVEVVERNSIDPMIWRSLRRVVAEARPQIIHAHEYKTDLLALLLARGTSVIPLSTAHGWTGHTLRERLCYYPIDKRLLARFPAVIAVSNEIKTELLRHGAVPSRVRVIPNGIDHHRFTRDEAGIPLARAIFGLAPGTLALGSVGRIERQKRFDVLLKAFARVISEFPSAVLLIAGEGSLKTELEHFARSLNIGHACRFIGHVHDVPMFHHALDAFVQSSDYEGTPNAVLEAMALRTPLVATDAGGTAELFADGAEGLLVPRGNPGHLFDAIVQTFRNLPAARKRAIRARQRIETDLSFETRMRKVEALYRELAGASREVAP